MTGKYRAVQYGCGPIGCSVARLAAQRADIELVGAIDIDPDKVGRDLGEVIGLDRRLGVTVSDDAAAVLAQARPDVVFLTTGSSLKKIFGQLTEIVKAGANVVSTAEELAFPWRKEPELSAEIDRLAREHGVTVLATGVNPGFLMDTWPLAMTAARKSGRSGCPVSRMPAPAVSPFRRKSAPAAPWRSFSPWLTPAPCATSALPSLSP